jgi:hypothetical protein
MNQTMVASSFHAVPGEVGLSTGELRRGFSGHGGLNGPKAVGNGCRCICCPFLRVGSFYCDSYAAELNRSITSARLNR